MLVRMSLLFSFLLLAISSAEVIFFVIIDFNVFVVDVVACLVIAVFLCYKGLD